MVLEDRHESNCFTILLERSPLKLNIFLPLRLEGSIYTTHTHAVFSDDDAMVKPHIILWRIKVENKRLFALRIDKKLFSKLEEYCKYSGQTKTYVIERALYKYLNDNMDRVKEINKFL